MNYDYNHGEIMQGADSIAPVDTPPLFSTHAQQVRVPVSPHGWPI